MLESAPAEDAFRQRTVYPPRNFLRGKRRTIVRLNFCAARRAACFPPYTLSLNILVTTRSAREVVLKSMRLLLRARLRVDAANVFFRLRIGTFSFWHS